MKFTYDAVAIAGPGNVEIRQRRLPRELAPGAAIIAVKQVAVCGGEIATYTGQNRATFERPRFIGHEFVGEVIELGEHLQIPNPEYPFESAPPHVERGQLVTGFVTGGAMAEYVESWEHLLLPIGPWLEQLQYPSLLGEPAMCCMSAILKAGVKPGDDVLILGAGPMALTTASILAQMGCATVTVAARRREGRQIAKRFGATHTVGLGSREELLADLRETIGRQPRVTFEATGAPPVMSWAYAATQVSGTVSVLSFHEGMTVSVVASDAEFRALAQPSAHTRSLVEIMDAYQRIIRLAGAKRMSLDAMVTHVEPLRNAARLFRDAANPARKCVKAVLTVG